MDGWIIKWIDRLLNEWTDGNLKWMHTSVLSSSFAAIKKLAAETQWT